MRRILAFMKQAWRQLNTFRCCCLGIVFLIALNSEAPARDENMARQVLSEINLARTAPRTYSDYLRTFRGRFQGKTYLLPGSSTRVRTHEGKAAVDEAIRFLERQRPLPPLSWSDGLAGAAADLATDQGMSGDIGHGDRPGHGLKDRVERYGDWERHLGENIGYGPTSAREMVMQLIIDDGVKGRGHRQNTFSPSFTTAGVACGSHPRFTTICVIDFAGGFRE